MAHPLPLSGLALAAGLLAAPALAQQSCGRVSIAEMNWASAGVAAQVDRFILEAGFGCTAELVTGDTIPTFTSMQEKGAPDIAPEMWVNSVKEPLAAAVAEGRLVQAASILADGAVEGWWVPRYIVEAHPEITTVAKALERPDLFPAPERPERGGVMNCPSGWACQVTTANLFRAFGAGDKGFDLVDSGSAAGLDGSIGSAFERRQGWLGYYWAPTAILGKYDMVRLDMGAPVDTAEFTTCTTVADCPDPKVTDYPVAGVYTVVTRNLADTNPVVMDYLGRRAWGNATVNAVLAWMEETQGTNEDAALHFLETYPDVWKAWLAEDVAARVAAAL